MTEKHSDISFYQPQIEGFAEAAGTSVLSTGDAFGRLIAYGLAEILAEASVMTSEGGTFLGRDSAQLRDMAATAAHRAKVGFED